MENRANRSQLSKRMRLALALASLAIIAALAIAWRLEPAARGYGTHEQLGLAPCWIHAQFGIVCPTCGMTTAWAHAMRGQLRQAAVCNAGGLLAWGVALVAAPWMLATAALGRWPVAAPRSRFLLWIGTTLLAITLIDWLRRAAMQ